MIRMKKSPRTLWENYQEICKKCQLRCIIDLVSFISTSVSPKLYVIQNLEIYTYNLISYWNFSIFYQNGNYRICLLRSSTIFILSTKMANKKSFDIIFLPRENVDSTKCVFENLNTFSWKGLVIQNHDI